MGSALKNQLSVRQEGTFYTAGGKTGSVAFGLPFWLCVIFLIFEYGRPHETLIGIGFLRPSAVVIILLGLALLTSGHINLRDIQTKMFVVFLGLMVVDVPFAVNNFWAFYTTRDMINLFIVYLAIVNFVDSFEKFQVIINVWVGSALYLAVNGLLHKGSSIGAFFGDENDLALFLNIIIPLTFFLGLHAKANSKRLWFLIITGLFLLCNVVGLSRGGFIGMIAVGFYCWLRSPRKILSLTVVLLLILVIRQLAPEGYWDEMETITTETDNPYSTGNDRIYSWKAAWSMFLDHPILGVGPGNFPWNFENYEPPEGFGGRGGEVGHFHGGRQAHSLYFTVIPELGTLGTFLYAWMVLSSLKDLRLIRKKLREQHQQSERDTYCRERIRYLTLALEGSLAGFLVSGVFISVLYYPHFWIWMALVVALKRQVVSSIPGPESMHNQREFPLSRTKRSTSFPP
jgi:probable O-glycosylation ligase (exosortase A-associated)